MSIKKSRPVIGITTSFVKDEQRLSYQYVEAVISAGGTPIILPITVHNQIIHNLSNLIDGLIVIGGPGITKGLNGTLPDDLPAVDDIRIKSDIAFIEKIQALEKSILGICYGMQLLNVLAGGLLYADVQNQSENSLIHSPKRGKKRGKESHSISCMPNTIAAKCLLKDTSATDLTVNTFHIQAIKSAGDNFTVTATAPDGVVEMIEHQNQPWIGTQFHPEKMGKNGAPLFEWLIHSCQDRLKSND